MRIALISDVHGNLVALEAVLAQLKEHSPDQIVCLGDVASLGPYPVECIERLESEKIPVTLGNTDSWLLNPVTIDRAESETQKWEEVELWCESQLDEKHRQILESYPMTLSIQCSDEVSMLCFHTTPNSHTQIIDANTPQNKLQAIFDETNESLLVGGRTHMQVLRQFDEKTLLNPGSVGLPRAERIGEIVNPLWAEYMLVDVDKKMVDVTFKRAPIDHQRLIESTKATQMPNIDFWLDDWA